MDDTLERIQASGVVGAGGAGFPTHIKLGKPCEHILVNGAECEPLLEVDQHIAAAYAPILLDALDALAGSTGAQSGVFALKEKYHDALRRIDDALPAHPRIRRHLLPNVYPAGDEQVLVYDAFRRIVPEGGLPLAVGVVVLNVETLFHTAQALLHGTPVTEKFLTVGGAVKTPATVKVPVGISFREVLEACGGPSVDPWTIVDGGPMMGRVVADPDEVVTKTTKGILVFPPTHPLVVSRRRSMADMLRLAKIACCHCMLCTDVCPRYLLGHGLHPDKLMRLASYRSTCEQDVAATEAFLCCECGLCETACIMGLQPWKLNQDLKRRMAAAGIENPHRHHPDAANPFREYRLFPVGKLLHRLGVEGYARSGAPLREDLAFSPRRVVLKLKQHAGAPAVPEVAVGDRVTRGQRMARGEAPVSAHIHASIDGVVRAVEPHGIVVEA